MPNLQIVDVEIGGRLAGPYRVVVTDENLRAFVGYFGAISLAAVAQEAAGVLGLSGDYVLEVGGYALDAHSTLRGDLTAELGRRA